MKTLWHTMGCLRQAMYAITLEKGISHQDVLLAIQRIDEALNCFYNKGLTQEAAKDDRPLGDSTIHPRRQAILNFMCNYPHRYPPSIREIGLAIGLGSSSSVYVYYHLAKLEEQGYIKSSSNRNRYIAIRNYLT